MIQYLNKIIQGDSLEILRQLPSNSVDAVITDPPYSSGGMTRAPHKGYFRHQCEYIVWGTKGGCQKAVHGGPWPGCYRFPVKQSDKFQLTGKPTPLMERLVSIVSEGSIILDPFAGSGTTLVAAKNTGRQFIGIEKGKEYAMVAEKRLSA
jgi:site-specific DNA-methyltransferase (adenine-specific)